jgi:hypothetical protein
MTTPNAVRALNERALEREMAARRRQAKHERRLAELDDNRVTESKVYKRALAKVGVK